MRIETGEDMRDLIIYDPNNYKRGFITCLPKRVNTIDAEVLRRLQEMLSPIPPGGSVIRIGQYKEIKYANS